MRGSYLPWSRFAIAPRSEAAGAFDGPLLLLAEAAGYQRVEGIDGFARLCARCRHRDRAPDPGPEHHQPHDGVTRDRFVALAYFDRRILPEFLDHADKLRRGPRVQPLFVDDLENARDGIG